MTEQPPDEPEVAEMPRWIPVLIGAILVALAGLAVFTGMQYRRSTLTSQVRPRQDRAMTNAPPGEPGAGASLVLHGESGENTPIANEPGPGQSRTVITGGRAGVATTARVFAQRGMVLNVLPDDAMVYVNDLPIGQVRQFNTMDEVYDFAEPGSYTVRVVAPNGAERKFVVVASEDAKQEVVRISAKL